MKKIAWLTDTHFDCVLDSEIEILAGTAGQACDLAIFTGDISNGSRLSHHLGIFVKAFGKPVYFVLGNHDYYGRSRAEMHKEVADYSALVNPNLHWLTDIDPIELEPGVFLTGVDGWYDGVHGSFFQSNVWLNDFSQIKDFQYAFTKNMVLGIMRRLGLESATKAEAKIEQAIKAGAKKVIFATHVPPFPEASTYRGRVSDHNWAPFFTNWHMGCVLEDLAAKYQDREFLVLAGHSHGEADIQRAVNLRVMVQEAEYCAPVFQELSI